MMHYSHLNDCNGDPSQYNFTLSMQERRNTCVLGTERAQTGMPGYWRHPGFALIGTFRAVGYKPGVLSYEACAQLCDDDAGPPLSCGAFTWNEDDRLCLLMVLFLSVSASPAASFLD